VTDPHFRNVGLAAGALIATSSTLVCCVLPALLVAMGAGAAVVSLVSAVPQLVWLSEHKGIVFGIAGSALIVAGIALRNARRVPCPVDALAAASCVRLRRISETLYGLAAAIFMLGGVFAFLLA
jgi:hypothetical protein